MNKTICAYPWRAAAIRPNGATIPCCRYPNLEDSDVFVDAPDPRNSEHWNNLRNDMLAGKSIDGCRSCYQDEDSGLKSMRQESLSKFIPVDNKVKPIGQLEVALSNLCNLACAHCSSYFSTKWYTEDVKAGRIEKTGIIENDFNFDHWDLSQLTELKIIGGEPFMEQKRFINLLKNLDLSKIKLQICTNGTVLPNEELRSLIESCETVYLCVSLDGLGTTNDWYRWPSKFKEVINIIKTFEEWWKDNSKIVFIIHHVINAVNILELTDFVNYMKQELPLWKAEWDWIRWPHWQELSVLPNTVKHSLIEEFKNLDRNYQSNRLIPNPFGVSIERLREMPNADWNTFKLESQRLSKERHLEFLSMVPSFENIWKD